MTSAPWESDPIISEGAGGTATATAPWESDPVVHEPAVTPEPPKYLNSEGEPDPNAKPYVWNGSDPLGSAALESELADPSAEGLTKTFEQPYFSIPKPEAKGVSSGIVRGATEMVEGLETPENATLLAVSSMMPPGVQKLVSLGFGGQMMRAAPDEIEAARNAKTPGEAAQHWTRAALSFLGGGLISSHAGARPVAGGPSPDARLEAAGLPRTAEAMRQAQAQANSADKPAESSSGTPKSAFPDGLEFLSSGDERSRSLANWLGTEAPGGAEYYAVRSPQEVATAFYDRSRQAGKVSPEDALFEPHLTNPDTQFTPQLLKGIADDAAARGIDVSDLLKKRTPRRTIEEAGAGPESDEATAPGASAIAKAWEDGLPGVDALGELHKDPIIRVMLREALRHGNQNPTLGAYGPLRDVGLVDEFGGLTDKGRDTLARSHGYADAAAMEAAMLGEEKKATPPPPATTAAGAAESSETAPTSIKNEATDADRAALALQSAGEPNRRPWQQVNAEAEQQLSANPSVGDALRSELAERPRAVSDTESAILARQWAEAKAKLRSANEAVNAAFDSGDQPRLDAAQQARKMAEEEAQGLADILQAVGTKAGQALAARQMFQLEQWDLPEMLANYRAKGGGVPLTEVETQRVRDHFQKIQDKQAKADAAEKAAVSARDAAQQYAESSPARERIEQAAAKEEEKAKPNVLRKVADALKTKADEARARIAQRAKDIAEGRQLGAGPDVQELDDYAIIGASYLAKGLADVGEFTAALVKEFGEGIRSHAADIYAASQRVYDQEREAGRLASYKARVAKKTAEYVEKRLRGDFDPKKTKPLNLDAEALKARAELETAKREYYEDAVKWKMKNRPALQRGLGAAVEGMNTSRAIITSIDLSAVGRQGGFITFGHPIRALKAFPDMIRALLSPERQAIVEQQIRERPNAPLYKASGLYLAEEGGSLSKMEEAYMSRLAKKIPLVAASERAYQTFLNRLRADSFDDMTAKLTRRGEPTLEESRAIANFVNVATGRGNLGQVAAAGKTLSTVFFAPRYAVSRFQLLMGQPLWGGTARTRMMVAGEYARYLGGVAAVMGLAHLAGGNIELKDPKSPDFAKVKFGNTRIDFLAGLGQATVFVSREGDALRRFFSQTKEKQPKYGTGSDVLGRFMRTKLAPALGTFVDALSGKNVVGEKVTPESAVARSVVPLSIKDIYESMQEQGIPGGTAIGLLSIFGIGVQNYESTRPKKK